MDIPVVKKTTAVTKSTDDSDSNDEETEDPSAEFNAEPNEAEGKGDPVSVSIVYKDSADSSTPEKEADEAVATVELISGVDANGNAIGKDPLVFYVHANPGWVQNPTVKYAIQKEDATWTSELTPSGSAPTYSISPDVTTGTAKGSFSGDIRITITGTKTVNTLKTANTTPAQPTMYLVATVDGTTNPAIDTTGVALPFSMIDEDAEIKVAIPDADVNNKYAKLTAEITTVSGTAETATRNEGTEQIMIGGTETKCVTFTFKPSDLNKYEQSVNADADYALKLDKTGAAKTLSFAVDSTATNLWEAAGLTTGANNAFAKAKEQLAATTTAYTLNASKDGIVDEDNAAETLNADTYAKIEEEGDEKGNNRVLVFNVDAKTGKQVSIKRVWAELTIPDGGNTKKVQEIDAGTVSYTTTSGSPAVTTNNTSYTIDLSAIDPEIFTANVTMTIKAETEFNAEDADEGFEVHNITFTGDLDNVVIKKAGLSAGNADNTMFDHADNKPLANPYTDQADTFNFSIKPKTGYTITKGTNYNSGSNNTGVSVVTVSCSTTWKLTNSASPTETFYINVPVKPEEFELISTNNDGIYTLNTTNNTLRTAATNQSALPSNWEELVKAKYGNDSDVTGITNGDYSLKNIEINVKTELVKDLTGVVRVDCPKDMSYEITGTDIVKEDVTVINHGTYTETIKDEKYLIGEDADLLVLSITSPVKPAISLQDVDEVQADKPWDDIPGEGGVYTATIPVSELLYNGLVDNAKIVIAKSANRTLDVNKKLNDGTEAAFDGKIKIDGDVTKAEADYADANFNGVNAITDGSDITVTLTAKAGELFDKVTYKVGTDGEDQEATVNEDKTKASFNVKMTDNVTVTAETSSTFRYVVKYGSNADPAANDAILVDGVYTIPAGAQKVQIKAFNGTTTEQDVQAVTVYDGNARAAAKAVLSSENSVQNTITLTLSEKDGDLIRLELKGKRGNTGKLIDLPSISIRQDKAAEEILIADEDGNKVESVNIMPGMTRTYKVSAASGSLEFVNGNINIEIARDAAKAGRTATGLSVTSDNIKATYNATDKELTIEASNVRKGNDEPVIVRFYDVAKRANAKADDADKLGLIAGGEISVKLDSPAITELTPEVSAFNTVHNLQLVLSTPGYEKQMAENNTKIYYRVTVKEAVNLPHDGDLENIRNIANATVSPNKVTNNNKTFYILKSNNAASQEVLLPVNYQYEKGALVDKVATYNLTVDLVHHMNAGSPANVWDETGNLIASQAATLTTSTAKATYQTKLSLSTTSATVYTGQAKQKIASATFDNNEGVCQLKTSFVNAKTGVILNNVNSAAYSGLIASAGVDGSIYVDATYAANSAVKDIAAAKDLALKVSAYADDAKEVSELIKIKLVDGVGTIAFENGTERVLYKQDGKAATMQLKAVLNESTGVKAKKAAITYVLADAAYNEINTEDCTLSQNLRSNVTVDAKTGKVTVKKNYVHNKDKCTFAVLAKVAGKTDCGKVKITISQEAQVKGDIVIVDEDNNVVARDGGTLSPELFMTGSLYVKALKGTAKQTLNKYNNADYLEGVSFTSGNKKALEISKTSGKLKQLSASKKAVKITAVNTDGSKKVKSSITVNLAGPKSLGVEIKDAKYNDVHHVQQGTTYKYSGALKEKFYITPVMNLNGTWKDVPTDYYKNLKITIKSAKKTQPKNRNYFEIIKSAPVTTITIADKTDKNVAPVTYTIEQSPATPVKGKTLKIKSPAITQQMVNSAVNGEDPKDGELKLKFQITGKDAASYAGKFIMLTPDYSRTKLVNKIPNTEEYTRARSYFLQGASQKVIKIDADGSFTVPLEMLNHTVQSRVPGTYKLIATVGEYTGSGLFESVYGVKATTVSVKIPGKAPKTISMQTEANYTLNLAGEAVDLKTGFVNAFPWNITGADSTGNYAKNVVTEDGTKNNFTKYFKVTYDSVSDSYKLGMKSVKVAELDALLKDETGRDLKGYVTITTTNYNNTSMETRDVLINVTLDQAGGLVAKADETFRGAEAIVKIYNAGDDKNACALSNAVLDKSAGAQTGASVKLGAADTDTKVRSLVVKVPTNAADTYTVDLKVLTANSAYATASDKSTNTAANAEKYGASVKVEIKVSDPATATDVVEVLTDADDLAFNAEKGAAPTNKADYNAWYTTSNKKYTLRVDVKSKINGAEVNGASYDKAFADKAVKNIITVAKGSNNNEILLTLDKAKFQKECAASETLDRGATVEIPVAVKFNLAGLKEEIVTLAVKLPTPQTFEEAKASITAAQAEIESIQPDEYLDSDNDVTSDANFKAKVQEAYHKALPLDTDAVVDPADIAFTKNADGNYEQKVNVQAKTTKADGDYEHTFVWGVPSDTIWSKDALKDKIVDTLKINSVDGKKWREAQINDLDHNKNAGVKVTNDYTADSFMTDVIALLNKNGIALGNNLSLKLITSSRNKAKVGTDGLFTFNVVVVDSMTKAQTSAIAITVNITGLVNFGQEGTAVETALANMNYEQAIYDALGTVNDTRDLENKLQDAIEAEAKKALTNKDIEVEFAALADADKTKSGDADNKATAEKIAYKLPADATNGWMKFKINLTLDGVQPYEIKRTNDSAFNASSQKDGHVVLTAGAVGETGKTFQTVNTLATALSGNQSGAAEDKVIKTWTAAAGNDLAKAVFKDAVEIGSSDSLDEKVNAAVKEALKGIVTGMYLEVNMNVTDDTDAEKAKGTITVTDSKKRAAVSADNYSYKFDYEMNYYKVPAAGEDLSLLGTPKRTDKSVWDALSGKWNASNDKPAWDRVSGLEVGEAVRVGENDYKVPLTGTLKYVEGWTGFSTTSANQSGYYALVSIPVPAALKTIAVKDSTAEAAKYIQVIETTSYEVAGSAFKAADGNVLDLKVRVEPETGTKKVKAVNGVRGFKVIVDYNSLDVSGATATGKTYATGTNEIGGKEYKTITYTFDMSGVTLDNSSEAIINVAATGSALDAAVTALGSEATGLTKAKIDVSGNNNNGKSNVIKVSGELTYQTGVTGYSGSETKQSGYFMVITLDKPANVTPANAGAKHLTLYNASTLNSSNSNTSTVDFTPDGGSGSRETFLIRVNDENLNTPKNGSITIKVDWDGTGTGWGESTTYTLDLSDVTYKPAS